MKRLERKQEKERLERQIHQQMLKEQESLMKELRSMLPKQRSPFLRSVSFAFVMLLTCGPALWPYLKHQLRFPLAS